MSESSRSEPDLAAGERDRLAGLRDFIAGGFDSHDTALASEDAGLARRLGSPRDLRDLVARAAERGAQARLRAARDRSHAAADRAAAALDRDRARRDRERASLDELTGVARRGPGLERVGAEIARARREGSLITVGYVDVDGLKAINDRLGHGAGDRVLQAVAHGLLRGLRPYDVVVRVGGDEFVCALPGAGIQGARARFEGLADLLRGPEGQTISFGLAEPDEDEQAEAVIARADAELLRSRRSRTRIGGSVAARVWPAAVGSPRPRRVPPPS